MSDEDARNEGSAEGSADNLTEEQEAGANEQWEPGDAHSSQGDAPPPIGYPPVTEGGVRLNEPDAASEDLDAEVDEDDALDAEDDDEDE